MLSDTKTLEPGQWTVIPAISQDDLEMRISDTTGIIAVPIYSWQSRDSSGMPLLAMHVKTYSIPDPELVHTYLMFRSHTQGKERVSIQQILAEYLSQINPASNYEPNIGIYIFSGTTATQIDVDLFRHFDLIHTILGAHLQDPAEVSIEPWLGTIMVSAKSRKYPTEYHIGVKQAIGTPARDIRNFGNFLACEVPGPHH